MPIFNLLNMKIEKILECFDSISLNEETISEKIMTKKQAKKKRLAKKRAKMKAQQQAEKEKQNQAIKQSTNDDVIDAEIVNDGGNSDNNEDSDKKDNEEFKSLIVYDAKAVAQQEQAQDYTEEFKEVIKLINELIQKYSQLFDEANKLWEQVGKDKPCPQNAYDKFRAAIDGCQEDFNNLTTNIIPKYSEKMHEEELNYLDIQLTAINRFLEECGKAIDSLHPEQLDLPDNLGDVEDSTEITSNDGDDTDNNDTTKNNELQTKHNNNIRNSIKDKEIESPNILKKDFDKLIKNPFTVWKKVTEAQKELAQTGFKDFIKRIKPVDWFEDRIWSFVESPLVTDFIKTVMYSNPFTAFIYDGKLGNFGIKDGLAQLKDIRMKRRQAKEKVKAEKEAAKNNLDDRGLLKSPKDFTMSELKSYYKGNQNFIDFVNTAFYYPETSANDKSNIKKLCDKIEKGFKDDDREIVVSSLSKLFTKLNEIADYQGWNKRSDISDAAKEAKIPSVKKDAIERTQHYDSNRKDGDKVNQKLLGKIESDIENKVADKDIIKKYTDKKYGYSKSLVQDYIELANDDLSNKGYQESYNSKTGDLIKLCEEALA